MQITRLWFLMTMAMPACLLLLGGVAAYAADNAKSSNSIIKWVDEKGITHYGDKMPAQDSGRDNSVINSQGIVIKRNQHINIDKKSQDQATQDQQRRDRALLATFTSEQEIDLARDRNTQLDKAALEDMQQRQQSAKNNLADHQKTADTHKKNKQAVPADLTADLNNAQAEITKLESLMAKRRKSMETTQARFDEDKRRFRELKSKNAPPEAGRQD